MFSLPIAEMLKELASKNYARFFMPGHKGVATDGNLLNPLLPYDVTEISETDNLYDSCGVIAESQQNSAKTFGARDCFYLTNGTTGGLHSALALLKKRGKKVLVDRNCHKSVINGICLFSMECDFLYPEMIEEFNITGGYTEMQVENALKGGDFGGVIITSPTYYGVTSYIAGISRACKKYGALLIVDSAHGGNLGFCDHLPPSPIKEGADVTLISAHKTLPTITQGAYLFSNLSVEKGEWESVISLTNTSSPSYLIMASLEYGSQFMEHFGRERVKTLANWCIEISTELDKEGKFQMMTPEKAKKLNISFDFTRIIANTKKIDLNGYKLYDILYKKGVALEMADEENVVILPSALSCDLDFARLRAELMEISRGATLTKKQASHCPIRRQRAKFSPSSTFCMEKESIHTKDALGRVCGESLYTYPPGVPYLVAGEIIDEVAYNYINKYFLGNINVLKEAKI